MIDKKISVSEQVANLPVEAQLIFTWSIPHTDDLGLLPHSPRTLKAMVVPMWDMTVEAFGFHLENIVKEGLYQVYTHTDGIKYLRVTKFAHHQTLKKDRNPNTLLNEIKSWDEVEALGFHVEDNGNPREEKRSKEKQSKEKLSLADLNEVEKNFALFWEAYPNKTSKKKAHETWLKIKPTGELFLSVMQGLEKAKRSAQWTKDAGKFIPHPTTWLNQERWTDEGSVVAAKKSDKF